jgi:hypothetical protein
VTGDRELVSVELRFKTDGDARALGDRIEEAVRSIVGRDALEEFRVRTLPLSQRKGPRPVD